MGKTKPQRIKSSLSEIYGDFRPDFRQVVIDGANLSSAKWRDGCEGQVSAPGLHRGIRDSRFEIQENSRELKRIQEIQESKNWKSAGEVDDGPRKTNEVRKYCRMSNYWDIYTIGKSRLARMPSFGRDLEDRRGEDQAKGQRAASGHSETGLDRHPNRPSASNLRIGRVRGTAFCLLLSAYCLSKGCDTMHYYGYLKSKRGIDTWAGGRPPRT